MRLFVPLLSILIFIAVGCGKDKFLTKPTITIKEISGNFVPLNGSLQVTLECTDKEGDVQDSVFVVKNRLNKRVVPTIRDTLRYKFPVFPTKTRTEIVLTFDYQSILSAQNPPFIPGSSPAQRELDTLVIKFAVKDNAGNISDTVISNMIQVFRQ
ncbi:MAG: hypothetical protein HOP10_02655 [Chitinophagaceae bacterium]|nr:hypothetical protein [Chitinophagaceae bacterium]